MAQAFVDDIMETVLTRNPSEMEFHQAVRQVAESIAPVIDKRPDLGTLKIFERLVEPERQVLFRVPWVDDTGQVQVNRGFRVEFNSALGPYKAACDSTRRSIWASSSSSASSRSSRTR